MVETLVFLKIEKMSQKFLFNGMLIFYNIQSYNVEFNNLFQFFLFYIIKNL